MTDTQIRWTLINVLSYFSLHSCDGLWGLFKTMFPDSAVADSSLQKDKCAYYLNYGIAPYFQSILVDEIQKSEYYAPSFDESLNLVIKMGQMALAVNCWDDVLNRLCTQYLDSTFVGHSWSNDLLEHFLLGLQSLDKAKLIQVSVNDPNVNWAFLKSCIIFGMKMTWISCFHLDLVVFIQPIWHSKLTRTVRTGVLKRF